MLKFKLGELLAREVGSKEQYELNTTHKFEEEDPKLLKPLKGTVTFIKTTQGINAEISNFETTVELTCSRCLEKFLKKISISSMEEHFYITKPKGISPIEQLYFIDMKHQEIDLSELVRQEILITYDIILLCKETCKGLCPKCGKNLNKENCDCNKEEFKIKPFAKLKDLLK